MIRRVGNRWAAVLIASILSVSSVSAQTLDVERSPYPSDGVILGTGWNSFKQEKTMSTCIRAGVTKDTSEVRPPVRFREVRDANSLMNFLSVSVKAKAKSILGGSASASASFAQTVTVKNESLNYAIDARIIHGVEFVIPLKTEGQITAITKSAKSGAIGIPADANSADPNEAAKLGVTSENQIVLYPEFLELARKNPIEFRRQCGDGFVSAIYRTTGIVGVYSFTTKSLDEKTKIKAAFSASGGPLSVSAAAEKIKEQYKTQSKLDISYSQLGGAGTPFAIDDKGFRALIEKLGTSAVGAAATEIGIKSYRDLPNFPTAVSPTSLAVDKMANQYFRLFDLYRNLRDADGRWMSGWVYTPSRTTKGWELAFAATANLPKLEDELLTDMGIIRTALQLCAQDPVGCKVPDAMKVDDYHYIAQMPTHYDMARGFVDNNNRAVQDAVNEYYAAAKAYRLAPSDCEPLIKANKKMLEALWLHSQELELQRFLDLRDIAKQRCDDQDPLCLTNAQLETWKKRIMVSEGKSAPTDIYGCKVDAWKND